jgi:Tfp pilus assembly protein PilV
MKKNAQSGFSLVEVLMIITFMSTIIIPFTLLLSQTSRTSRGTYIQSSRSILMNHLMDEMDPDRTTFYSLYNNGSMNTATSESGQVIPYMRKVDNSKSNALKRTTYLYLYNNASDAATSPRYKTTLVQTADEYLVAVGSTANIIDNSGNLWHADSSAYDATNKVPGYVTGSSGNVITSASNVVNTTGYEDAIFQSFRDGNGGGNIDYNFDVTNGDYIVKLYFAEMSATVTNTSPNRRLMDIYLEGNKMNASAYSPYETMGNTSYMANIVCYDVNVADGVLNVSIRKNASSNLDARISGISIRKRRVQ